MKLFRLAILSAYLSYLSKNKKQALAFINLGIFLCIFAVSTAAISFFIEKKISEKQNELLYLQLDDKDYSRFKSDFVTGIDNYQSLLLIEEKYFVEKEYLAQSEIESQLTTDLEFFGSYIYANSFEIKNIFNDKEFMDFLDPENEDIKALIELFETAWGESEIEKVKNSQTNLNKSLAEIKKINFESYKLKNYQSLDEIISEIINYKNNNVYNYDEKVFSDYFEVIKLMYNFIDYFNEISQIISSLKEGGQEDIKKINSEIISLSKKEKNYILVTFLIQFVIFLIIQFFEINSINFNLLESIKRNAKKIK
tara:strand:- start:63 stop:992 length:930 start_codon:yes stop_codon:yes gene_type:complete